MAKHNGKILTKQPRLFHLKMLGFYNGLDLQAFCSCHIISLFFPAEEYSEYIRKVVLEINLLENWL